MKILLLNPKFLFKLLKENNKTSAHIIIWYFHDTHGQMVLTSVPVISSNIDKIIFKTLSRLADVHHDTSEVQFSYSDKVFSSQNYKFSIMNQDVRGHMMDFVISLIAYPSNRLVNIKLIDLWDYIPAIKKICFSHLIFFNKFSSYKVSDQFINQLKEITDEINQMFALTVN